MKLSKLPLNAKLAAMLKKVKDYKMTHEEMEAQRRSWVIGEMMLGDPDMTREEAETLYNSVRRG